MRPRILTFASTGYSLIELLLVLAVLGVCLVIGSISVVAGLRVHEARGAAQVWQSAAAWAQVGVLWHGGTTQLRYESGDLSLSNDLGMCGGDLGRSAPAVPVTTNLTRWRAGDGAAVSFSPLGAPDGGGSLFFRAWQGAYRVVIRPESGLTLRSLVQP
jgi:prepilin-type N-terminal cleavage/methylation domain-containing protein